MSDRKQSSRTRQEGSNKIRKLYRVAVVIHADVLVSSYNALTRKLCKRVFCFVDYEDKKLSYRWQTARRVDRGQSKSPNMLYTIPYFRYRLSYSNFVRKTHHFWDIRLQKCRDLKPGLGDCEGHWIHSCSIATMALYRVVSVLNLLTGQKSAFSPRRGDSLHRFTWNLAWPRATWVHLATRNFTPIGSYGWERGPQISKKSTFW